MHLLILIYFISAISAFVLPAIERSDGFVKNWFPLQLPGLDVGGDNGFSNFVIRSNTFVGDNDAELSNQTSRINVRDEETTAPPSSVWQALPDSQWDDWHRDVVVRAWNNALKLAQDASNSLTDIMEGSEKYKAFWENAEGKCKKTVDGTRLTAAGEATKKLCYRHFIAQHNLAYGQYFGADPDNIGLIQNNFQKIVDLTGKLDAPYRDNLQLYLTWGSTITDINKNSNECVGEDGTLTQALVISAKLVKELQGTAVPMEAQVIHFCPPFFDVNKVGRMEIQETSILAADDAKKREICRLDKLDSTARVLLHEFTHLHWVINTNESKLRPVKDTYGWFKVIGYSVDIQKHHIAQKPHTKKFSSQNADNYAWMAIYNHFNSLDACKGVKYTGVNQADSTCNTDVWPQDTNKPVATAWGSYPGNDSGFD
ncbi:hypothetical protein IFR05_005838 [Cadophora sp. M221]|nr:hypothetical protein IFR05_005838 [Cadophora sp. M221]